VNVDRAPAIALAGLVGGILAGERAGPGSAVLVLLSGVVALAASWFLTHRLRVAVATIALALLGCAVTMRALDGQAHSHLSAAIATRAPSIVTGVVADDPDSGPFVASAIVRVRASPGETPRLVLVQASGTEAARLRALVPGDRVLLRGRLGPLRATSFDGALRWRHVVGRLDGAELLELRDATGLFAVAGRLRDVVVRGTRALSPTPRALLSGFLLGDTRAVPDDLARAYRGAGLSHLLAVSGANVAFVMALFAPVLRRMRLGARTAGALAIVVVFAAMTRFEPSVLRASAMAAVALGAGFAGRPASSLRRLVLAVVALLLCDPFLLHSVGFLLSASASAGLALASLPLGDRLPGPRWCAEPLATSIAAQLGVTPVLLAVFGTVPVVTPLANLLAAPAASVLGSYGFVASAAAGVVPALGPVLHQPSAVLVGWVSTVAELGAAVPLELDRRGALAVVAGGAVAGAASLACTRARRAASDAPTR
jgi:competence protein ComEC